ncbi:MAG: XdhC/CoxI family protein [Chloroflexota bacterium]
MSGFFSQIRNRIESESALVVATVVDGPAGVGNRMLVYPGGRSEGSLGSSELDRVVVTDALEQLARGFSKSREYDVAGGKALVFMDAYPSPHHLMVFGGVHIAVPLVKIASVLGFRTSVIDARGRFASTERFPEADEIALEYADEYLDHTPLNPSSYVVVLSHDPKLDDPALLKALRSDARYVGAIGSRKTHAGRVERLLEAGLSAEQVARIHAPVGLDIDAQNPEEIALAIVAEVVAAKNGKQTRPPARPGTAT